MNESEFIIWDEAIASGVIEDHKDGNHVIHVITYEHKTRNEAFSIIYRRNDQLFVRHTVGCSNVQVTLRSAAIESLGYAEGSSIYHIWNRGEIALTGIPYAYQKQTAIDKSSIRYHI